ncbi:hypothetical protein J007_04736 [Cryptococcus neoformans]|nr:hypothetical protein C356_04804 [Cryptococcus neoformans var. grubii c45]OXB35618.1 hypothetical protein J007_04736 [Cryptococcus neoformans var. grubii]
MSMETEKATPRALSTSSRIRISACSVPHLLYPPTRLPFRK